MEGEAAVELEGIIKVVRTRDVMHFPSWAFHDIRVQSERIKRLAIYPPPVMDAPVSHPNAPEQKAV